MANTTGGLPQGRARSGGGAGKRVGTHGPGLGTGPVGKSDGYRGRSSGGSGGGEGPSRSSGGSGGRGKLIAIAAALLLAVFGGGTGISALLGGGGGGGGGQTGGGSGSGSGASLSSLFTGNGAYSDGSWAAGSNNGVLADTGRRGRTVLKGDGTDTATVMVYLCGTDLESKNGMASADLREMAAAKFGDSVRVLVCTGGCKQWRTNGVSNARHQIYRLRDGKLQLLEKEAHGSRSMTDPAALSEFIRYCGENYPANRNILILWDHGGGAITGYGYDETNAASGSMPLAGIAKALKDGGVSFDVLGFDACLMATAETALTVSPYADYLLASEETEPGIGWYYTDWLTALGSDPGMPTPELGRRVADDFVKTCAAKAPGQKATLSLTALSDVGAKLGEKLSAFAKATADAISGGGYAAVSKARSDARAFGSSGKGDMIDLAHLALLTDSAEGKALSEALRSAVVYNRVSAGVTNAYGLSAYFPYRGTSNVSAAVTQLDAIGMDGSYTDCVKKFATLQAAGQSAGGGSASPFGSLFGSASPLGNVTDLIGALTGSGGMLDSLLGDASVFDRGVSQDTLIDTVTEVRLPESLAWTEKNGKTVLDLPAGQWENVSDLLLNVFLDDGSGYIDLGLDNVYEFTKDGDLIGAYDGMWVSLNSRPVAYYFEDQTVEDGVTVITGRVPVLLNGERAELLIVYRDGKGEVAGARYVYPGGETDAAAKAAELTEGDVIQPICDRYRYDGTFEDAYMLGDEIVYTADLAVSDVTLDPADGDRVASYVLTDRFAMEHWTARVPDNEKPTTDKQTKEIPDPKEELQNHFSESIGGSSIRFSDSVRNDTTGRWRCTVLYTSEDMVKHALDYYHAYFSSDDELHFICNLNLKTTTAIAVVSGILYVDVHEYVENEEHDAKVLNSGKLLASYTVNTETGKIERLN